MKAAIYESIEKITIKDVPVLEINENEVLIKIKESIDFSWKCFDFIAEILFNIVRVTYKIIF